jgi:hypothetical protein
MFDLSELVVRMSNILDSRPAELAKENTSHSDRPFTKRVYIARYRRKKKGGRGGRREEGRGKGGRGRERREEGEEGGRVGR